MNISVPPVRASEPLPVQTIDVFTDTRDILAHARKDAHQRGFADWLICDIDAHHFERCLERDRRVHRGPGRPRQCGALPEGPDRHSLRPQRRSCLRYQSVGGRIPHQDGQREKIETTDVHRDVVLTRRAMDSLGIDYMVVFPTPMLFLGMHPQPEMEVYLGRAYNKWLIERVLAADDRIRTLAYLPFNTPEEAERTVKELGNEKSVIGFCVTSTRYKPVHHNDYMRLYAALQDLDKPVAFHSGYYWQHQSLGTVNRFLGMHALGFVWCNMVHMTNWVLNGIPERFPNLKSIWIESGLAWVPFLMQRLDDQFLMRQSEAPLLKQLPSEYMRRNCWYTSQPMETTHPRALEVTLEMINAETQLLFSSDWPHYDFDLPATIYDLPFLSEQAKRNILGLNAARIFHLDPTPRKKL